MQDLAMRLRRTARAIALIACVACGSLQAQIVRTDSAAAESAG